MGHSQKAPTPFQPPNQAGSASAFQQGAGQLAQAGQQLSSQVDPQLAQISSNIANNPFYAGAQQGAGQVAALGPGVANTQFGGSSQDTSLANINTALAPTYGTAPAMVGAQGLGETQSFIPAATIPGMEAGLSVLNTAFDPQSALYDRSYQQMIDQQNAINSQAGVAGTPYGASLTGNQERNFNIDWQNNQLNRQIAGLGAYGTESGQATSNLTNLVNTGAGVFDTGIATGTGALSALTGNAVSANQGASDLATAGLNTLAETSQLPADVYAQQQEQVLRALIEQITGVNAASAQTQQAVADQGSYLNIGQTAAQGAINAAQVNNQAQQAMWSNIGNILGDVTGLFAPIKI